MIAKEKKIFTPKIATRALIIFLLSMLSISCEELVDVDVTDLDQKIVIDGLITDAEGKSRIKITFSDNPYTLSNSKNVAGVKVMLKDNLGNEEYLTESSPGVFIPSKIKGVQGRTYYLTVQHNGTTYNASSKMNPLLEMDSIKFKKTGTEIFGITISSYYAMNCYITNKSKLEEYGLIVTGDGSTTYKKSITTYNGKYLNGVQTVIENSSTKFYANTFVNVEFYSLDKQAYNYFYQLSALAAKDGLDIPDFLRMTSYNPHSNLSNNALGYFSARAYKKYTVRVQ